MFLEGETQPQVLPSFLPVGRSPVKPKEQCSSSQQKTLERLCVNLGLRIPGYTNRIHGDASFCTHSQVCVVSIDAMTRHCHLQISWLRTMQSSYKIIAKQKILMES